jgi:hypothetical protein
MVDVGGLSYGSVERLGSRMFTCYRAKVRTAKVDSLFPGRDYDSFPGLLEWI